MLNGLKYILDIGSSCLRLNAVSRLGKQPHIVAKEVILYDGYMDGEFLSPDEIIDNLSTLIENMHQKMRKPIKSITVGVPSDFCVCVCKRISRQFETAHKLTSAEVDDLYSSNSSFGDSDEYAVINYSPMQFVLDDNVKTLSPVGKLTTSLVLDASFVLAKRKFIDFMLDKLHTLGVGDVDFVSTALGQALFCAEVNSVSNSIAVVDVGHISTSVAVLKGEGLALLSSFSMGGGHISSDIMQVLGMTFKDAEMIKRKAVLTIESEKNDYYEVCFKGNLIKAPIYLTNQVVKSRIESIAKVVKDILDIDQVFAGLTIYITGDGIANFKGAKSVMKDVTEHEVKDFKVPFDNTCEKFQTSALGLARLTNILR